MSLLNAAETEADTEEALAAADGTGGKVDEALRPAAYSLANTLCRCRVRIDTPAKKYQAIAIATQINQSISDSTSIILTYKVSGRHQNHCNGEN